MPHRRGESTRQQAEWIRTVARYRYGHAPSVATLVRRIRRLRHDTPRGWACLAIDGEAELFAFHNGKLHSFCAALYERIPSTAGHQVFRGTKYASEPGGVVDLEQK